MKPASDFSRPIDDLLSKVLDGTLDDRERETLVDLLRRDPRARQLYHDHIALHALFHWKESSGATAEDEAFDLDVEVPSGMPTPLSTLTAFNPTWHGTAGYFANHSIVLSYLLATVLLGFTLLTLSAITVSRPVEMAGVGNEIEPKPRETIFVARIKNMIGCTWSDPSTAVYVGSSVPLGRKYDMASGLVEIAYASGAKVILEGPCTYTVESAAGGYLARGKLTARIRDQRSEVRGQKSETSSLVPHPSYFVVKTPTAIVTDLGTEFGVEVGANGETTSYVFRGSVKVQALKGDGVSGQGVMLRAKESVRVEINADTGETRIATDAGSGTPPKFARWLIEPPKLLDLLDVIAGGSGTGRRRERGIDPATGREDALFMMKSSPGTDRYQPVAWHRLIDGVFAPKRHAKTVQLDSAGHTFDGFDFGTGGTVGSVWARAVEVDPLKKERLNRWVWVYTMAPDDRFMPNHRGLLCLHSNTILTFDLEEMRKLHQGSRPARFRATAGIAAPGPELPDPYGKADLWVFVDGKLKQSRKDVRIEDGVIDFNVEIDPDSRFLTLVSTDGRNGCNHDWAVFGDPVLEMTSTDLVDRENKQP